MFSLTSPRHTSTLPQTRRDGPSSTGLFSYFIGCVLAWEEIQFPEAIGGLWATVELKPTVFWIVFSALSKMPELQIEVRLQDWRVKDFRYVAEMIEVLVSPLILSTRDFLSIELQDQEAAVANSRSRSMSISVIDEILTHWMWRETLSIELFQMNLPRQGHAHWIQ